MIGLQGQNRRLTIRRKKATYESTQVVHVESTGDTFLAAVWLAIKKLLV